jgi:hypothetical protein
MACGYIEGACNKIAAPVIAVHSATTGVQRGVRSLLKALGLLRPQA